MTPTELTSKLQAGDQLLVRHRMFHRLSYTTSVGGPNRPVLLGIVADASLAASLVAIPGGVYTSELVSYAEYEDPAEAQPRVPAYILAAQLEDPVATVATLDVQLATQLSVLSAADIAALIQALRPPPGSSRGGGPGGGPPQSS